MIRFCMKLAGEVVNANVLEGPEDVAEFVTWVRLNEKILGCDTETTGLDWWADDFKLRTVQFGNNTESYVVPVEVHEALLAAAVGALRFIKTLVFQNAPYDLLVLNATTDIKMEELWPKVRDTRIYAHLVDNRGEMDGGPGHSLLSLTKFYIDSDMGTKIKGSVNDIVRSLNSQNKGVELSHYEVTVPAIKNRRFAVSADFQQFAYLRGKLISDEKIITEIKLSAQEDPKRIKEVFRAKKAATRITKETVWKAVPVFHGGYLTYAALDPVLAFRLFFKLKRLLPQSVYKRSWIGEGIGWMDLPTFEHKVAEECSYMSRRGIRLDIEYTQALVRKLLGYEEEWTQVCRELGVENPWSNKQLMDYWFPEDGEHIDVTHPHVFLDNEGKPQTWISYSDKTGDLSLSDDLLKQLEKVGDMMAMAVRRAKSARKKRTTWLENFLNQVDSNGYIHPSINSIKATTARMSIQGIPAQTLPSGDWEIRRCFLADFDDVVMSTDYKNMELRFLAAWSGDERMLKAFENEDDLHQITADGAGVSRKIGKMTNFLVVFGGGPEALSEQAGIPYGQAKEIIDSFERTYPGVAKFMEDRKEEAKSKGYITTPSGRRLMVGKRYAFRGTNYFVQSGSRDITCRAILRLAAGGFRGRMLLPIHDEILFSVPQDKSKFAADLSNKLMEEVAKGLMIPTDPDKGGESWGSLYIKDLQELAENDRFYEKRPEVAQEDFARRFPDLV